jgi:hypothetical protein
LELKANALEVLLVKINEVVEQVWCENKVEKPSERRKTERGEEGN